MDKSIFLEKSQIPNTQNLFEALGDTYDYWMIFKNYVLLKYPEASEEWNYSNYGWSFRMKDKKRVIIYLLPREKFFKTAFVFGQKATDIILQSAIALQIKSELESAKVYAEGRGIRIDIKDSSFINDIKELIDIKITH